MVAVAKEAAAKGVFAMCGHSYRRTPALALAKQMVEDGKLGTLRHVGPNTFRTGSRTRTRR